MPRPGICFPNPENPPNACRIKTLRSVFGRRFSECLASDELSCVSLAPFVSDRRDARPSASPIQLTPDRHGDLYFRGELCSTDAGEG